MSTALTKRIDRRRERHDYLAALADDLDSDSSLSSANDDSISDQLDPNVDLMSFVENDQGSSDSDPIDDVDSGEDAWYQPDSNDNVHDDEWTFGNLNDDSSPLYPDAHISTKTGISKILQFSIACSLSKSHTSKLFDLIKSILPASNNLPTTQGQLLKLFDRRSSKFGLRSLVSR